MAKITSRKHARSSSPAGASLTTATVLTGLTFGLPLSALGQTASSGDELAATPDQVIVYGRAHANGILSSRKYTQPLVDTTQTINVIDADLFSQQGATSLTEALRNSPGVGTFFVGENGSTTTGDAVYMRGFDSSGNIFVDGVRDLGSVSRDVFNVEQVEVAKGAAGTDIGRGAPTGAINLVTKQPLQENLRSVSVSSGAWDEQHRATADLNYYLGNGTAVRLNAMAQSGGVPGRDEVFTRRWGVAPSAAFGLGSATRYYIDVLHVDQGNLPDGGVPTIGLPGYSSPDPARPQIAQAPRVPSTNFYGTTSDYDDVVVDMLTFRVEHDFENGMSLQNTARWGRNGQNYMLTSFMVSQDPTRFSTPDLDDRATWEVARALPTFKDQTNEIMTNQTSLVVNFGNGAIEHDLSTGMELIREELTSIGIDELNGSAWPAANLYAPDPRVSGLIWGPTGARGDGRTDTVALYAFDTTKLGERWQINAGARIDWYETRFNSLAACGGRRGPDCGTEPSGTIVASVDEVVADRLFNWKLGALFKPTERGSVYVNYAISQQPPGGNSLELSTREGSADNPIFDPQKAETAEVGTKWNLFGRDLLLTAALYDTRVTNELVQDPIDQLYYQTGKKRVRGIEINALGKLTDAWSLSGGVTTMDARVEAGPDVAQDGSRNLTYTPDKALTLWSTYAFPFGLTVGGGVRHSGELHRGADGAPGTPELTQAYTVWDVVVSFSASEQLDLRLNVNNLFDEEYVAAINKSGYRYTPGVPRSFLLTASLRF